MMVDDKFSIWDLKNHQSGDDKILAEHGIYEDTSGAGAADPKAIDFLWHQRNFENALHALRKRRKTCSGWHGRKTGCGINHRHLQVHSKWMDPKFLYNSKPN
jgi:hypothetical protein